MQKWHSISYTPCPIKKIFEKAIDCPLGGGLIIPVEAMICLSMKSARDVALQKKAIEYYEEQGLTRPQIMENGYRVFSEDDVIQLNKIAVLRGLGISVSDIKTVLAENDYLSFQTICDKKELEISDIQAKQQLLHMLARNQNWEDARAQLSRLEMKRSILSRLLDRFPGYFGKFISLHFAPYLNERVATDEQQDAFETIIDFLDGVNIVIPDDLKEYLDDAAKTIDLVDVSKKAAASVAAAIQDPEQYLKDNREMFERYKEVKASDAYKNTPGYRLQELFAQLNRENGYNDVFIPAMRRLSSSYREYYEKLLKANEVFLKSYRGVRF